MIRVLYLAIALLVFIELYSIGVMLLAKKTGEKDALLCLVPFYAFKVANRLTGTFAVLTIPVKKYHSMVAILVVVSLLAMVYGCWGDINLPVESIDSLWQIMGVVMGLCGLLFWISLIASSRKVFRRFNVDWEKTATLIAALVITIPFMYIFVALNKTPRELKDMY